MSENCPIKKIKLTLKNPVKIPADDYTQNKKCKKCDGHMIFLYPCDCNRCESWNGCGAPRNYYKCDKCGIIERKEEKPYRCAYFPWR